jgi:DnaK suppressor protein
LDPQGVGGVFSGPSLSEFFFTPIAIFLSLALGGPIFHIGMGECYRIMEYQDLEYFRGILTQSLNDLLKKGDETVSLLLESTVDSSDFIDQATLEAEWSFRLRMRDRENKLIRKIRQSLLRIEAGTFGICERCGEDIAINRLKVRPVTTNCIACKNKMEAIEKVAGI